MKIVLLDYQFDENNRIMREFQGGFGLQLNIGRSFWSKILLKISKNTNTPLLNFAYIASYASKKGYKIVVSNKDVDEDADVIIMNASMLAHEKEVELYTESIYDKNISNGIYSILNDTTRYNVKNTQM